MYKYVLLAAVVLCAVDSFYIVVIVCSTVYEYNEYYAQFSFISLLCNLFSNLPAFFASSDIMWSPCSNSDMLWLHIGHSIVITINVLLLLLLEAFMNLQQPNCNVHFLSVCDAVFRNVKFLSIITRICMHCVISQQVKNHVVFRCLRQWSLDGIVASVMVVYRLSSFLLLSFHSLLVGCHKGYLVYWNPPLAVLIDFPRDVEDIMP